jgi:hypothetical protein
MADMLSGAFSCQASKTFAARERYGGLSKTSPRGELGLSAGHSMIPSGLVGCHFIRGQFKVGDKIRVNLHHGKIS